MTSFALLGWIVGAVALQLVLYLGIAFSRHWQSFRSLQDTVADASLEPLAPVHEEAPTVQAWTGYRWFRVHKRVLEDRKGEVCSFYLQPEDGAPLPPFKPGQFLTFKLDVPPSDGPSEPVVRCYSLSDAPQADHYRVSIKRVPAPAGSAHPPGRSSNYFHDHVQEGTRLQVRAPGGHFFLEPGSTPVVLIAGGIGITPMLSMLSACAATHSQREVWLFYGVRDAAELAMAAQLEQLAQAHANFKIHLCLSQPGPDDMVQAPGAQVQRHASRVDMALLRALLPLKPFHFYLCGPTAMLQSLVPGLDDWGVPDAHIHFEAFGPASVPRKKQAVAAPAAPGASAPVSVTFSKSGKTLAWEPGSGNLLAFAEAHGIAIGSGCRAGSCGSCHTRIQAGEVAYTQSPDFDPLPGCCLVCVTTPKTNVSLEA